MLTALGLAIGIGLLLGLLGGGGSILTVPMLVYVLQVAPKTAIATSFVVVGVSSLMALIPHARRGHVCWKSAVVFGIAGMGGAFGGGRLAGHISGDWLMVLFGLVTLTTGLAMMFKKAAAEPAHSLQPLPMCPLRTPVSRLLFDGALVGGLTGLVGVGGGFLIVPALTLWVGLPMPAAIGTSLLVIVMNAMAGFTGYINHAELDLALTAVVTAGAVAGSGLGAWLSNFLSAAVLRRGFGWFVVLVALYVLSQALTGEVWSAVSAVQMDAVVAEKRLWGGLAAAALLVWIGRRIHHRGVTLAPLANRKQNRELV